MTIHTILPRHLPGGFEVEYFPSPDGAAPVEAIIWRNESRDDGFVLQAENETDLRNMIGDIFKATMEASA